MIPQQRADRSAPFEGLVRIDGGVFYAVPDIDVLPPFLVSVVSDGDRWMFVSSTGALTAGRVNASTALFPYETDDRLHDRAGQTGPVTSMRVTTPGGEALWRPFDKRPVDSARRCLYKSIVGDSVIFEEVNQNLQLSFSYRWSSSQRFGFIRLATLRNESSVPLRVDVIDGLLNILPYGLEPSLYQSMSNLTHAYKRSEIVDEASRLGVFSLESRIADRPEPAEVLKGTVVWSLGLEEGVVTLASRDIDRFERGVPLEQARLLTGKPGAYLLSSEVELDPGAQSSWYIVADVAQDQSAVAGLRATLGSDLQLEKVLSAATQESTESLTKIMSLADGQQRTGDPAAAAHHFANVTYNVMRGGVPLSGYTFDRDGFAEFVRSRNLEVAIRHSDWIESLPEVVERSELHDRISELSDPHLVRLGLEYLPFSFSRRHGDPSRPWNAFSIRVRDEEGEPLVHYEGNWRDIFQNWEALCRSFPEYLPSVIAVFVNASTADGFNPYRLTSEGIDWEVPDPDDPWSNIGYWGDHQIVYLSRLLGAARQYLPGAIERMLGERWFAYADVPYRLAPYEELVGDPKSTIAYDEAAASLTEDRVAALGSDGKLISDQDGQPILVTLLEKLIVPALSKLSSFVPGGGIWMNTQRPEWNDANNALVGYGLSMVTLYHLHRYMNQLRELAGTIEDDEVELSAEVSRWLSDVLTTLRTVPNVDVGDDHARKQTMDALGHAFSQYRTTIYRDGFTGTSTVSVATVRDLCETAIDRLEDTIRHSRRGDGLYHSYNLIRFSTDRSEAAVEHLDEMLEGQVAVLDSGFLSAAERADVIDALFDSAMYRADQESFTLYPSRQLPSFLDKNVIPAEMVETNALLSALVSAGNDDIVSEDPNGDYRFNSSFENSSDLNTELGRLGSVDSWADLVESNRAAVSQTYEDVFNHHSYTGRSGSMYAYEGIGSIYWHMVAKLLVAVQESAVWAGQVGSSEGDVQRLVNSYWRVRAGLGFNKTAEDFGAIPLDPYSHTPSHAGAQQPGMTGLVKEEILTRLLEVGVRVANGEIVFDDLLLSPRELLSEPETWGFYDKALDFSNIELEVGSLALTICQTPVIVARTDGEPHVEVMMENGASHHEPGLTVPRQFSELVFSRSSEVTEIRARLPNR